MHLRNDGWYQADKGKHFVLTKKGKENSASYRDLIVGEPVDEYDTEAVGWSVEKGYVVEVNIPDWIVKEGYEVVYDYNNHTLHAGNPIIFPEIEIAQKYLEHHAKRPWMSDRTLYIKNATFEGKALKACREYNGQKVYNSSWYYGATALRIGDLVEKEIVDDMINCLPPACWRSDCAQCGEAFSSRIDENGDARTTYVTFKQLDEDTWVYCGDCFRGENVQRGEEPTYIP